MYLCCAGFTDTNDMKLEATGLNSGRDHYHSPHVDSSVRGSSSEEANFPIIHSSLSPNVVGVLGKEVRLACYVTGLGKNRTVWMAVLHHSGRCKVEDQT